MNAQHELIRLLGIKKDLLTKLLESIKRSAHLLQEDDMDAFDSEMEACKEITSTVDELGFTTDRVKEQTADVQHEEIAKLESGIAHILEQIEFARKECNDVAQQKLQMYGQQIKAIRHTKKGIDGYASQSLKREAIFIDEKK